MHTRCAGSRVNGSAWSVRQKRRRMREKLLFIVLLGVFRAYKKRPYDRESVYFGRWKSSGLKVGETSCGRNKSTNKQQTEQRKCERLTNSWPTICRPPRVSVPAVCWGREEERKVLSYGKFVRTPRESSPTCCCGGANAILKISFTFSHIKFVLRVPFAFFGRLFNSDFLAHHQTFRLLFFRFRVDFLLFWVLFYQGREKVQWIADCHAIIGRLQLSIESTLISFYCFPSGKAQQRVMSDSTHSRSKIWVEKRGKFLILFLTFRQRGLIVISMQNPHTLPMCQQLGNFNFISRLEFEFWVCFSPTSRGCSSADPKVLCDIPLTAAP